MTTSREKWNRIYKKDSQPGSIAAVLEQHADLLPTRGRALDIACGSGANAIFLAERGMAVDAWDISDVVIDSLNHRHPGVYAKVIDINAESLEDSQYDLILTCHYLDRSLAAAIRRATSPGGMIIYQTFTAGKKANIGPSNPDFLLTPDDLEDFVEGCQVLVIEDGTDITDQHDPMAGRACIIAQKPLD